MKREVGLWIDRRKTVIVSVENEVEETREIRSNIEKHIQAVSSGRSKAPNNSQGLTNEVMQDQPAGDPLGRYYEGVISFIRDADSIWLFGPGEARVELENRLKHEGLGERIVGNETVNKMTDHQIAAKVRDRYLR